MDAGEEQEGKETEGRPPLAEGSGTGDRQASLVVAPEGSLAFSLSRTERGLLLLLVGAPIAIALELTGASATAVFTAAALSIVPLAALMGRATEELAIRSGPGMSGLLNATFGNATELIIATIAIKEGLFEVAKASLTGSIIGNILLVLGLSFVVGGLKHPYQRFQTSLASATLSMLTVSVVGITLPSMYHQIQVGLENGGSGGPDLVGLSVLIACVLLAVYLLYLVFSLKTHRKMFDGTEGQGPDGRVRRPDPSLAMWPSRVAVVMLLVTAVCVAAISELLVGAVEGLTEDLGISELFVGVVIIAVIGNAAEHSTAVLMAARGRSELSFHIAMGSSVQIALLVAPVLVFISFAFGDPMELVFEPFELVSMIVTIAIATVITLDGEATWFEGAMLVAIFLVVAAVFYVHP